MQTFFSCTTNSPGNGRNFEKYSSIFDVVFESISCDDNYSYDYS